MQFFGLDGFLQLEMFWLPFVKPGEGTRRPACMHSFQPKFYGPLLGLCLQTFWAHTVSGRPLITGSKCNLKFLQSIKICAKFLSFYTCETWSPNEKKKYFPLLQKWKFHWIRIWGNYYFFRFFLKKKKQLLALQSKHCQDIIYCNQVISFLNARFRSALINIQ